MIKLMHFLFGWEYVLVTDFRGELSVKRIYKLSNDKYYFYHYSSKVIAKEDGETFGCCLVRKWEGLTFSTMKELKESLQTPFYKTFLQNTFGV